MFAKVSALPNSEAQAQENQKFKSHRYLADIRSASFGWGMSQI